MVGGGGISKFPIFIPNFEIRTPLAPILIWIVIIFSDQINDWRTPPMNRSPLPTTLRSYAVFLFVEKWRNFLKIMQEQRSSFSKFRSINNDKWSVLVTIMTGTSRRPLHLHRSSLNGRNSIKIFCELGQKISWSEGKILRLHHRLHSPASSAF